MWGGVLSGFAGVKLSGSPRISGRNKTRAMKAISRMRTPKKSLIV